MAHDPIPIRSYHIPSSPGISPETCCRLSPESCGCCLFCAYICTYMHTTYGWPTPVAPAVRSRSAASGGHSQRIGPSSPDSVSDGQWVGSRSVADETSLTALDLASIIDEDYPSWPSRYVTRMYISLATTIVPTDNNDCPEFRCVNMG